MLRTLREMVRNYEEHCDQLIANGFEPNQYILNKIEQLKRQIKLMEDLEEN